MVLLWVAQAPTWAVPAVLPMECSQAVQDLRVLPQVECHHLTACLQVVLDPMVLLPAECLQAVCLPAAVLQVATLLPAATRATCSAILSSLRPSEQTEAEQIRVFLSAKQRNHSNLFL
jgi:hypothetical protein